MVDTSTGSGPPGMGRSSDDDGRERCSSAGPAMPRSSLGELRAMLNEFYRQSEAYKGAPGALGPRRIPFRFGKPNPGFGGVWPGGRPLGVGGTMGGGWIPYTIPTRAQINILKNEMQRACDALKETSRMNIKSSDQIRVEYEKLKMLTEDLSNVIKAELDTEVASMKMTKELAVELKLLVDDMKAALKAGNTLKRFDCSKIEQYKRASMSCLKLGKDLTLYAAVVTSVLFFLGYIELSEPAPFHPRETKAGKLLYDDFGFGLSVRSSSTFGLNSIMAILAGDLGALQSQVIVRRIEENWRCQIGLLPGHDVVMNGSMEGLLAKDLKLSFNLPLFIGENRKVKFVQRHRFGSIGGSLGLNANPLLNLTAMFGNKSLSAGGLVDYDTVPRIVRRLATGAVLNFRGLSSSLLLEKLFQPQGAMMQPPQPLVSHTLTSTFHLQATTATSFGAEVVHQMEGHHTTFAVGIEHSLDASTRIKGKLTNELIVTGLVQQSIGQSSSVSVCAQVNLRAPQAEPRLGLSVKIGY